MNKSDELDFIKEAYSKNEKDLPENLSKESITAKLENVVVKKKKGNIISFRRIASLAAVFAVVICALFSGNKLWNKIELMRVSTEEYQKIENHFLTLYNQRKNDRYFDIFFNKTDNKAGENINDSQSVTSPLSTGTFNGGADLSGDIVHSETNVQVKGVDEGDIIKNDGKYIYILTGDDDIYYHNTVRIIRAADLKEVGKIVINEEKNTYFTGEEIYVNGDRLTLVGTKQIVKDGSADDVIAYGNAGSAENTTFFYDWYNSYDSDSQTLVYNYDISNRENPKLVGQKEQSGYYNTSRMTDGIIYVVSSYGVNVTEFSSGKAVVENCIPVVNETRVSNENIETDKDEKSTEYTVITSSDVLNEKLEGKSFAYLGACNTVYCSGENLYFTQTKYENGADIAVINSVELSKDDIKMKATGEVKGVLNNQFSLDEYNGYLRVAITEYNYSTFKNESKLYILNDKLETVGKLENLAEDEEIKSARFVGDRAYVVTFKQTDPLFIIDLSDPANPTVKGSVKLPGYSTYLHPISSDFIIGVGYGGNETDADVGTLKVTLFDVSDATNPKAVSDFEICDAGSDVTNYDNHKAFLYYAEKNLIGIPVIKYADIDNNYRNVYSYALLEIKDGELQLKKGLVHKQEDDSVSSGMFRGAYIGENFYTVTDFSICQFDLADCELVKSASFDDK